ncbi:hypothetical protein JHK85_026975 [Glycine max]|nr:hypothetical protein JHK85_026975 [Glycine max]
MVAGTATLKLNLSDFSSPMSSFSASSSSSSFPFLLSMRTPSSSSKPRFLSQSLPSLISSLSPTAFLSSLTCAFLSGIYALTSNDIKVGTNLEVDGAPWRVLEFLHVKPGKGAAFVRTKMKNYITGNTVEKTFRAGSSIEQADVFKETKQFTYKDGVQFVFMDLNTYEEFRLGEKEIGDRTKWLKEGMDLDKPLLDHFGDKLTLEEHFLIGSMVIDVELPITIKLTVVDVDPGLKGDTAQGGTKPATLDTSAVVNVPLFVNVGDEILVDSRTGQYMSRA